MNSSTRNIDLDVVTLRLERITNLLKLVDVYVDEVEDSTGEVEVGPLRSGLALLDEEVKGISDLLHSFPVANEPENETG